MYPQRESSTSISCRFCSDPTPFQVTRVRTAEDSRRETSRTSKRYVPYPRLRVSFTSAASHFPGLPEMRRCNAPLSSVQTFAESKKFLDPARKIGPGLVVHS